MSRQPSTRSSLRSSRREFSTVPSHYPMLPLRTYPETRTESPYSLQKRFAERSHSRTAQRPRMQWGTVPFSRNSSIEPSRGYEPPRIPQLSNLQHSPEYRSSSRVSSSRPRSSFMAPTRSSASRVNETVVRLASLRMYPSSRPSFSTKYGTSQPNYVASFGEAETVTSLASLPQQRVEEPVEFSGDMRQQYEQENEFVAQEETYPSEVAQPMQSFTQDPRVEIDSLRQQVLALNRALRNSTLRLEEVEAVSREQLVEDKHTIAELTLENRNLKAEMAALRQRIEFSPAQPSYTDVKLHEASVTEANLRAEVERNHQMIANLQDRLTELQTPEGYDAQHGELTYDEDEVQNPSEIDGAIVMDEVNMQKDEYGLPIYSDPHSTPSPRSRAQAILSPTPEQSGSEDDY